MDGCRGRAFGSWGCRRTAPTRNTCACPLRNLHPKPPGLSWEEAAALPLAGVTAYRGLVTRGELGAGETLVVTGIGGGVATMALTIARARGARVMVTSGSPAKLARARERGAEGGALYTEPEWVATLRTLAGSAGPDLAIDGSGGATFDLLMDLLRPGGRLISYGATLGPAPRAEVRRLFWKQLDLRGTTMGSPRDFEGLVRLFSAPEPGAPRPVINSVFPLAEASAAHRQMESGERFGKIVLVP